MVLVLVNSYGVSASQQLSMQHIWMLLIKIVTVTNFILNMNSGRSQQ